MTDITVRIQSLLSSTGIGSDGDKQPSAPEPVDSALFQCETCEEVFIATDMTTCRDCGDPVERIRSSL